MKTKLFLFIAICLTAFSVNSQVVATVISITGEAQGGWAGNNNPLNDTDMSSVDGVNWTLGSLTVSNAAPGGGLKFRANHSWDFPAGIWGSTAFPSGIGANPGDNILCTAGNWSVTFNSSTGAYLFSPGVVLPVVKLIGSAVTPSTGVTMNIVGTDKYEITTNLLVGNAKFDVDGTLGGSTAFPNGNAAADINIPVTPSGNYKVSIDLSTGDYKFTIVPLYNSIAIVGPGAGGWPPDPQPAGYEDPNKLSTTNGVNYTNYSVILSADQIKFRQDNAWSTSWGGGSFPAGPTVAGDNIAVSTAGNWRANFNKTTGAYLFDFPSIAIVGEAVGGWPPDPQPAGYTDPNQLTSTDGETYRLDSLVVTNAAVGGGAKFRFENKWERSTGGAGFPVSTATNSDNILTVAGTYSVTYTRSTGAYTFGAPLANTNFTSRTFKVSPNPSSTNWEIVSGSNDIKSVQIVNVLGKVVYSNNESSAKVVVDASDLSNGIYFARVSSDNATETIKLIKN